MAPSPWDDFKTTRHEEKNASPIMLIVIVLFCAILGAGLGFLAGFYLIHEAASVEVSTLERESFIKWGLLIPTIIGTLLGAGTALYFLADDWLQQREKKLKAQLEKDLDKPRGPIL